ncbi:MAG: hypothetical protein O9296_01815 [Novosphingobium sp.]|nr:hypothetical protein [Novosphingobium sp.]
MRALVSLSLAAGILTAGSAAAQAEDHKEMAFSAAIASACMYRVDVAKMQRRIGTMPTRRQEAADTFAASMVAFEASDDQMRRAFCEVGCDTANRHGIIAR